MEGGGIWKYSTVQSLSHTLTHTNSFGKTTASVPQVVCEAKIMQNLSVMLVSTADDITNKIN